MLDLKALALLPENELAQIDIAVVNLACAAGLPGGPTDAEAAECLKRLDDCAAVAADFTRCGRPRFLRNPGKYQNSEAYFHCICLVSALWQECGIRYNVAKIPEDVPLDTPDSFVHGALLGAGGTCASLPVVYAAVGRRLGYPIKLASTRRPTCEHLFARWDDPKGERLNLDVNATGLSCLPDDYYRNEPYEVTPEWERVGGFLVSMTPRRELADFLLSRGFRWQDHGRYRKAVEALAWASVLAPEVPAHLNTLKGRMNLWLRELNKRRPPRFPPLMLDPRQRRYPTLPTEVDRDLLGMEAMENILNTPELEERWWKPMREGRPVAQPPREAVVDFIGTRCDIVFWS